MPMAHSETFQLARKMLKSSSSEAAGKSKPAAHPQGYVEDFDEPRTKLAGFFSIRSDGVLKGRLGPDRLSQDSTTLQFL